MSRENSSLEPVDELEVQRRVKKMRDEELVDFIRETVTHLEVLAQRLEVLADTHIIEGDEGNAGEGYSAGSA